MSNRRFLPVAALLFGLAVLLSTPAIARTGRGHFVPDELVCRMLPDYTIDSVNAEFGTVVKSHQIATDCYLLIIPQGQNAESLAISIEAYVGVEFCRPNYYLAAPEGLQRSSPFVDAQARLPIDSQKAATTINLEDAHLIAEGDGINIALIDGGVNFSHPEFALIADQFVTRWDYVSNDALAFDEPGGSCSGHGTFIAGLLHLVAPASNIYVYRVLDTGGVGDGYSIAGAVLQAIDDSCSVINLSLGMVGVHDALDEALKLAKQRNIMVVASAGNDSTDLNAIFPFPATRTYCLAIAALDTLNQKADFSNYGTKIAVCTPGTEIYSTFLDTTYATWEGTSFAAPFVTGLAALILSVDSTLVWEQLDTTISQTAVSVDSLNPGLEGLLGTGLINPVAALQSVLTHVHGDVTGDLTVDISDLNGLVDFLFFSLGESLVAPSADADCNGVVDVGDLTALIDHLFFNVTTTCMIP
ncbi:MAG: S8 family serine peptidase [Candidatus Zixiibacteriota bacterium]